ncbi:MAG: YbhB/YbcL family Raf kinase inhibitor-like protein [Anaerolineae bacterium]|nr:YbhB/YbcL family Raf kinase inhibitor-like protein [Anaerolineae bacterium]
MSLTSPAFADGGKMPEIHTCHGPNTSPPLAWDGAPTGTQSFVLIMDDPDIPMRWLRLMTWTHWLVFDIPGEARSVPADLPGGPELDNGAKQAVTSFRVAGYGGPCPPVGSHRYHFRLYALDCVLDLDPRQTRRSDLEAAMTGHVLATAELVGAFR